MTGQVTAATVIASERTKGEQYAERHVTELLVLLGDSRISGTEGWGSLQEQTTRIVALLQSLAPDRPLNSWFMAIIEQGTGKVFEQEDNKGWTRITRPILEAFFHARFFLEMAVRYSTLHEPPMPLPSGYAALLYLYGLR